MTKLDIQSEPFAPFGNMSANGIIKQLGSPTLQKTRVLVRETVQNSDDARHRGDDALLPSLQDSPSNIERNSICFHGEKVIIDFPTRIPTSINCVRLWTINEQKFWRFPDWHT